MIELTQSQINKINTLAREAGFMGEARKYSGSLEYRDMNSGCASPFIYIGEKYGSEKFTVEVGHSSMGGRTINDMRKTIVVLTKTVKLAEKIKRIVK